MTDDRWNLKGSDPDVIEAFREVKQDYQERSSEQVTNDDALRMLIEGVDVQPAVDYDHIREIVNEECERDGNEPVVSNEDLQTQIQDVQDDMNTLLEHLR